MIIDNCMIIEYDHFRCNAFKSKCRLYWLTDYMIYRNTWAAGMSLLINIYNANIYLILRDKAIVAAHK